MVSAGCPSITLALSQPDRRIPDQVYLHYTFQKIVNDSLDPEIVVIGSAYSIFRDGVNNLQPQVPKEQKSITYWGNKNISDGVCDMIAIGRQTLADCYMPKKLIEGKPDDVNWCIACDNCVELLIRQKAVGRTTYEKEAKQALRDVRKNEGSMKWKLT